MKRFDPVTYVKITEQMDAHNIGHGRGEASSRLLSCLFFLLLSSLPFYPCVHCHHRPSLHPSRQEISFPSLYNFLTSRCSLSLSPTGGVQAALKSIKCPFMVIGMDSDLLYPLHEQEEVRTYVFMTLPYRTRNMQYFYQVHLTQLQTTLNVRTVACRHTWECFPRAEDWGRS